MVKLPLVMGHRGIAAKAPENTLAGIRTAAAMGLEWVELDVALTRDRVPVLFHDDNLERITGHDGLMAETDYADIKEMDAGSWFGAGFAGEIIPTLEQAVALIVELGLRLNLEIKPNADRNEETAEIALASLTACWPDDQLPPLISSFRRPSLAVAQKKAADWPRSLIAVDIPDDWAAAMAGLNCFSLHLFGGNLTAATVTAVKAAGYEMAAYTIAEPGSGPALEAQARHFAPQARELVAWGVDCIITDAPEVILEAIA